jgi:hypothetical protein
MPVKGAGAGAAEAGVGTSSAALDASAANIFLNKIAS